MAAEAIWVIPVHRPPGSHQVSASGHHPGARRRWIHSTPQATSTSAPRTEATMRGHVSTPSAAPRSARMRTGSTRRSAQSYCCDSRARPAKIPSSPGPGRKIAATPASSRIQPKVSSTRRLAAPRPGTAISCTPSVSSW